MSNSQIILQYTHYKNDNSKKVGKGQNIWISLW